jgi:hypothetical protein
VPRQMHNGKRVDPMKLHDLLQFSVCVFSILAAGFWLQSATNKLAKPIENPRWDGARPFPQALTGQSRWNAKGAVCAGIGAFSESVAVLLRYAG